MKKGWIQLHRQIQDCSIWIDKEPFDRRSAWIDLLLSCNHNDKEIVFDGHKMVIGRGQLLTSVRQLSDRWNWSKDRTLRYLHLLEELGMITKDSNARRTLLTIEKYEYFQLRQDSDKDTDKDTDKDSRADTDKDTHEPQTIIINNDKKLKKENIYNVQFEEFWKFYPRHEDKGRAYQCYKARLNAGYSEDELLTACKNYADECERDGREKRYIKLATTFLSINEPFRDYLEKGETVEQGLGDSFTGNAKRDAEIDEIIRHLNDDDDDEELWQSLRKV